MNIDVQKSVMPRSGLDHGSRALRADVLIIASPRLPTLYANFSIYKPLTSFVLLSDLLFPAVGGPIIFGLITYGRRPVYSICFLFFRPIISRHRRPYHFSVILLTYVRWPFLFYLFPFLDLQMLYCIRVKYF